MSKLYESSSDKANERRIIGEAAGKWGCDVRYMPVAYHMDAILLRGGKPAAFVEARKRNVSMTKYRDLSWSLQKYDAVRSMSRYLPTFFLVEWIEGIFYREIVDEELPVTYMDRTGTTGRDERDNEPCVLIPTVQFKALHQARRAA